MYLTRKVLMKYFWGSVKIQEWSGIANNLIISLVLVLSTTFILHWLHIFWKVMMAWDGVCDCTCSGSDILFFLLRITTWQFINQHTSYKDIESNVEYSSKTQDESRVRLSFTSIFPLTKWVWRCLGNITLWNFIYFSKPVCFTGDKSLLFSKRRFLISQVQLV